jgi:[ribosomal protein S18]-alanine N-acetyltransferase
MLRPMRHGDVEKIAAIERYSSSPWSSSLIACELDREDGLQVVALADDDKTIVGWCCGRYVAPEAELLKVAVSPSERRFGIGSALLLRFEDLCRKKGCETVFLEVRAANTVAIGLYGKFGYLQVGCRKNYYSIPQDDALIFKKTLRIDP